MLKPQITVRCDCGRAADLDYRERWTCPDCGRTWDTSQIPEAEYRERTRIVARYRAILFVPLLVLAAIFVPLVVFVDQGLIFLLAVVAFAYSLLYLPFVRRRAHRAITAGPTWGLHPE